MQKYEKYSHNAKKSKTLKIKNEKNESRGREAGENPATLAAPAAPTENRIIVGLTPFLSYWAHIHLRPRSFETTAIWDHIHLRPQSFETTFIWDHSHLIPQSFETFSFETTFIWDHIRSSPQLFETTFILDHIHFTPCQSEAVLIYCESRFYDLPSTFLRDLTLSAKTVAFVEITCQTFCSYSVAFLFQKATKFFSCEFFDQRKTFFSRLSFLVEN